MQRINPLLILFLTTFLSINIFCQTDNQIETVLQKGHSRYISCLDYSPDGNYIVTGSYDNTIILWNAKNGKEIRTFSQHESFIRTVYFSPDGKYILSSSGDNKAIISEIITGKSVVEIKTQSGRLFKACFSPDGSKILTMDDRSKIVVWNAQNGKKIGEYKKDYSSVINPNWFTSDGNRVITYTNSKEAKLVDLSDSSIIQTYNIEKPVSFSISPDNKYLAIGSAKKYAKLFNLDTGEELYHLDSNEEKPCDGCNTLLTFSHSGKYLATMAKYAGITIWDVKKGKLLKNFEYTESWVDNISFSPNDDYFVVTADDETIIWNVNTGKKILELSYNGLECIPVFSTNSKNLLTTAQNNTAALWNIEQSRKTRIYSGYLNKKPNDGLDFDEGNRYNSAILRYLSYKSKISITPDGKYIVKANIDSVAFMLNTKTGKIENTFIGHSKAILCSDISADGKWLITGSGDRSIKLWNIETGELLQTFKGHRDLIFDVKFSSDSKYIVSGSWDSYFIIWDIKTGKSINYLKIEDASPYCVNFTPNDLYIVSSDLGKELKLFEFDALKEFRNIVGHTDIVNDICFSPDGKQLITASLDGKVKVWDLLSGMLVNKFTAHTSGVFSVAYDPNGKFIASGSNDRTIKLWNPDTGKEIQTLTGHAGGVTSLKISEDGTRLFSCSIDGEIIVWDLNNFTEIYTYIQIDRNNWLAKNPQGYFDGSSDALKQINYVSGLEVISIGSLFEKYYSPNLIRRIQEGEKFNAKETNIQELVKNTPTVQLGLFPENTLRDISIVDSIEWFKDSISLSIQVGDEGGGIDEVRLYNNGKLILNKKFAEKTKRMGKKYDLTINVPLVAGENAFSAVAFDKERTESQANELKIYYDGIESDINLYILSIGINKYLNPSLELNYAIEDAKAYSKMITKSAGSLFNSVEAYFIKDSDADKSGIQKVFEEIAEKSGPEDVFIFYYAGHGVMSMDKTNASEFYIIPYDVTKLYGDNEVLKEKAISADELVSLSRQISARKQMFVLDACQSGGALEAFNSRGADREKAIAQLARSTGTFFLLASGAIQYASEAKDLGHGIFTYAILEGLEGKADGGNLDEKITANELKSYVEDRVPELTDEYMLTPQYPTGYSFGQDFPIVIVK